MENAGRWSLVRPGRAAAEAIEPAHVEHVARLLLRRYGVIFRALLARECNLPPWRELVRALFRLEARGEVRGGRFVAGFSGAQFAHPDAVSPLRRARRHEQTGELVSISAADPLNLLGIVLPGDRVPALADNRILLRDGVPVAVREKGEVRFLAEAAEAERWELRRVLLRREVPARLRAYLGRSA